MPTDGEQLARLRVAVATGHLLPDVGQWALDRIGALEGRLLRQDERDKHLRNAAALLLPGASRWRKAKAIGRELVRFRTLAAAGLDGEPAFGASWFVWAALRADPATPGSTRHLLRIIH